jgi:hypothetical protein
MLSGAMVDRETYLVALTSPAKRIDDEARALATDLGTTPYEARLKLAAGVPAIVLSTPDRTRADALAAALRARGHLALVCATSEVVAASAMTSLRRFQLDDDAILAGEARLPWDDMSALVRATHRRIIETTEKVKEKQLSIGRAIATGGLVMRKTTTRDVTTRNEDTEPVLYLFRASGEPAWILRERGTHFGALGARLSQMSSQNFATTVEVLRSRAPHARFDDRLLARKPSFEDVDLLAHLIAWSV